VAAQFRFRCQTAMPSFPDAPKRARPGTAKIILAYIYIPAARFASGRCIVASLAREGTGNAGARNAPAASRANEKAHEQVHHRSAATSGIPCAMGRRLIRALPGVPGLLATVAGAMRKHHSRRDPSVGGSGPHDFAARFQPCVRLALPEGVHRIPRPTSVTIAIRPSLTGRETREEKPLICPTAQARQLRQINTTGKSRGAGMWDRICAFQFPSRRHGVSVRLNGFKKLTVSEFAQVKMCLTTNLVSIHAAASGGAANFPHVSSALR